MSATAVPLPFVSVVMPVRNEGAAIERSLTSVLAQDYPADRLEVLVADGRSTDDTRERILRLATGRANVVLVDNPGRIVATGLNAALDLAKGEIVVRVDGHCEIAPDYVRRAVAHLADGELAGVGGPIETVGENPVADAIAIAMSSRFGVGGSAFRVGRAEHSLVDTVAFPAYPRRVIDEAGPFDEELVRNQDDEYNYRLRKAGGKLLLAPDVRSRYFSRANLRSLWRQYRQYGYWKVRVLQKHPRQMSARQFAPPLLVTTLIAAVLATLIPTSRGFGWPLLVGVAGAYLAANLVASCLGAARHGWRHFPVLVMAYAFLHLGYGLGFLQGLVRFAGRFRNP